MMTEVYIIRKGMNDFFLYNPDDDNWEWTKDIEEATIYATPEKAEAAKLLKKTGEDTYVFKIPYSVPNLQQRKKKISKKPKRKVKGKSIRKGKPTKRK